MEIKLIRHAEPEWVKDGKSVVNPPLSTRGFSQADKLGERLKGESFDHVFVSPLLRTRQTAAPMLSHFNRPEVIEPFLEEIREPAWHGQPAEVTIKAYRSELALKAEDRWNGLDGGEPVRDFVARIHAGATEFLGNRGVHRLGNHSLPVWHIENPGETFVFVAHAGTNSVLICHLLGLQATPWEWERFIIGHASITTLKAIKVGDGFSFSLEALSDLEHLERLERTR
jgi:probable phosphoglycerate mutase